MLSDLNFEARFGILSSFYTLKSLICIFFYILIFLALCAKTKILKIKARGVKRVGLISYFARMILLPNATRRK